MGLPWSVSGKKSAYNAGNTGLIPGSGRSPGEGNGNPFQYSCLGNLLNRGSWQAIVLGVEKRVRHDLTTKEQKHIVICIYENHKCVCIYIYTFLYPNFDRIYVIQNVVRILATSNLRVTLLR